MKTLKLPGLSPAVSQFLTHVAVTFIVAFGGQLAANATGATSTSTLLEVLYSAAAAGGIAVLHYIAGIIPTPPATSASGVAGVLVSLKLTTPLGQLLFSGVSVFLVTFGGQLAAGAAGAGSLPAVAAVVVSAASAGALAFLQWALKLVPVPTAVIPATRHRISTPKENFPMTTTPTTTLGYKYGRLAAQKPVGLRHIVDYLTNPLPKAPASYPAPSAPAAGWGMLGNDQYGDCTMAAVVHLREANNAEAKGNETTWPTANDVVAEYFKLSGGQDTGLVEANVLQTWYKAGLFGDTISGYAPVNTKNLDELRSVVALFGASYLGVAVPAPAQQQFGAGQPWDLTGTPEDNDIEGGHAVPIIGYDADYAYVVTWGAIQKATWRWVARYLDEAWAVLTSEDARVNLAALQADLRRL